MKKLMFIILFGFLFFSYYSSAWALNKEDLKKFKKTNECTSGLISSCDLEGASLKDRDHSNANLEGANLRGIRLENVNLSGANLEGADLTGAKLRRVDLSKAILTDAILENTLMFLVDFSEANLNDANIKGSILKGVSFRKANCEGVKFEMIDTQLVDFSEATGIKEQQCGQVSFGQCK